jgi:hypothetical protein
MGRGAGCGRVGGWVGWVQAVGRSNGRRRRGRWYGRGGGGPETGADGHGCLVILELIPNHDGVRDEPTSIHNFFRLDAEWRLFGNLLAQHVARHEVTDAEFVAYVRRLCALAWASQRTKSEIREGKNKNAERGRTCTWGPDEDGTELLRWRGQFGCHFYLDSLILSVSWATRGSC